MFFFLNLFVQKHSFSHSNKPCLWGLRLFKELPITSKIMTVHNPSTFPKNFKHNLIFLVVVLSLPLSPFSLYLFCSVSVFKVITSCTGRDSAMVTVGIKHGVKIIMTPCWYFHCHLHLGEILGVLPLPWKCLIIASH